MVHDDGPVGLDGVWVRFDDERVVSDAGIVLLATLAARLGLEALVGRLVRLRRDRPGAGNAGRKVMALIYAMALGADSIDDCDVLRAGRTRRLLGGWLPAPSTLGTFLRAFTFGHVRQLDRLLAVALERAWTAGAGPGDGLLTVDVDSFVGEVFGHAKQGAAFGYTRKRGYHPIVASRAETGEVLHIRLRKGSANTSRGMLRFCDELIARVERAAARGPKLLRADSGFWSAKVFARLERAGWSYSIGVRLQPHVRAAIEQIDETAWQTLSDYPPTSIAQITETTLGDQRLVVRRVRTLNAQGELLPSWEYFPFATNRTEPLALVEAEHRQHAVRRARHPRPQRPGARALPLGSLSRQRSVDRDRLPRAQPAALDRNDRPRRPRHPRRAHHPPPTARHARPADHPRRALDTSSARPLALADRLHRGAHPHPDARRRLTRPGAPLTARQTDTPPGADRRRPQTANTSPRKRPPASPTPDRAPSPPSTPSAPPDGPIKRPTALTTVDSG
jgi:hypothetical protein